MDVQWLAGLITYIVGEYSQLIKVAVIFGIALLIVVNAYIGEYGDL